MEQVKREDAEGEGRAVGSDWVRLGRVRPGQDKTRQDRSGLVWSGREQVSGHGGGRAGVDGRSEWLWLWLWMRMRMQRMQMQMQMR